MAERANSLEFTPEQLEQHPDALLLLTLLGGLMVAIVLGSMIMASYTAVRIASGKPILRVEPWSPRVWGLIDLILIAVLLVVAQTFSLKLWSLVNDFDLKQLREEGDFPLSAMAAGSLSYIVVMLLAIGWLVLRYRVSLSHVGFTIAKFRSNIAVGVGAALLSLPAVYFVMWLVSTGLNEEYDHPLIERMTEEGTLTAFLLGMFAAVIAAPISEEFLFRVLLQGWLQSIPFSWKHLWWFTGASERERGKSTRGQVSPLTERGAGGQTDMLSGDVAVDPYAPPVPLATVIASGDDAQPPVVPSHELPVVQSPPMWPVFVSGTLFGLAHWGYGLSFVPLILLGIILGFLYRATHSIWPGFVVHFILNLIAITSLGILTYVKAVVQ